MTTGIDIVREQIAVAQGHKLSFAQGDIARAGHAIELRINAEHPFLGIPSPGHVTAWQAPGGPGLPGPTVLGALRELRVQGITVNADLHRLVLSDPAFRQGGVTIHYLATTRKSASKPNRGSPHGQADRVGAAGRPVACWAPRAYWGNPWGRRCWAVPSACRASR